MKSKFVFKMTNYEKDNIQFMDALRRPFILL